MTPAVIAVWWLTCLVWGSVWLFVKMGVTDVPPISFAGIRLALALLILFPIVWRERRAFRLSRRDCTVIAASGFILLAVNYALVFWGTQFIASGTTAMLQAATPAFGILFARRRLGARIDPVQMFGAALGIAGVATVSANQLGIAGIEAVVGSVAVIVGAACVAFAYSVVKTSLEHVAPVVILVGQMIFGCVPLLIAGMVAEGNPTNFDWTPRSVMALIYLATVGSIAGFWLNLWLLRKTTTNAVLGISIVEPLLAVALGAVVLREQLHALTAVGAALILVSVWLVVFRRQSLRTDSSPHADGR